MESAWDLRSIALQEAAADANVHDLARLRQLRAILHVHLAPVGRLDDRQRLPAGPLPFLFDEHDLAEVEGAELAVDSTGEHVGDGGRLVGDEAEGERVDLWLRPIEAVVGAGDEVASELPRRHPIGTDADELAAPERQPLELLLVRLPGSLQQMGRQRPEIVLRDDVRQRVGPGPADDERCVVRRFDLGDLARHDAAHDGQLGVHRYGVGEHEIGGGERRTVVPEDVGPQFVGRLHRAVRAQRPGAFGLGRAAPSRAWRTAGRGRRTWPGSDGGPCASELPARRRRRRP